MYRNSETVKYIENCGRYDMKTKNTLDFFLEKGYVSKLKKKEDGTGIFSPITKT